MTCKARQYSDQMICGQCGLQWDVNDPEPPECLTIAQVSINKMSRLTNEKDTTNANPCGYRCGNCKRQN